MTTFSSAGPFNPQSPLVTPSTGIVTSDQSTWFLRLSAQIAQLQTVVNTGLGTNFLSLATQPSLGASDAGYVLYVTDYAHLVYWDGAVWQWMDGDRPGRFVHFSADPGAGWGVCDGSTYALLVVGGATLTTMNLVTPNLSGSPAYPKSAGAYTGTIVAASAGTISGTTGTRSTTISGSTDAESGTQTVQAGAGATVPAAPHTHGTSLLLAVAHDHAAGSLAVSATGEPAHVGFLPYVRR